MDEKNLCVNDVKVQVKNDVDKKIGADFNSILVNWNLEVIS